MLRCQWEHDGDDDEGCAGQHSVVDDVDMKCMLVDCFRDAEMMSVGA